MTKHEFAPVTAFHAVKTISSLQKLILHYRLRSICTQRFCWKSARQDNCWNHKGCDSPCMETMRMNMITQIGLVTLRFMLTNANIVVFVQNSRPTAMEESDGQQALLCAVLGGNNLHLSRIAVSLQSTRTSVISSAPLRQT